MDERTICSRCGFSWVVKKSKRQKQRQLCQSCRARRANKVQHEESHCIPWHGNFAADLVTPIDEQGKEFLAGKRTCGNKDCVQELHIEQDE